MNLEKVLFGFFVLLSLTLNFGFVLGDIDNPEHHHVFELFAAIVVSLIATIMKLGDRAHMGAVLLAASLVADLQLIAAAFVWAYSVHISQSFDGSTMASIVSLSGGALLANLCSAVLLVVETSNMRR